MKWPVACLGDLCQINIGRTPSRSVPTYWEGGNNPWLSISDMGRAKEVSETKEGITDTAISDCNMRLVQAGTVLFSFKLSIGKLGIAATQLFTNEAIASLPILDRSQLCEDYLFHALRQVSGRLVGDRAAMGITLNKASLAQIEIPLPPLEEQRRITAILDKAQDLSLRTRLSNQLASSLIESEMIQRFDRPGRLQSQSALLTLVDAGVTVIDCPHSTPQWTEDGKICLRTSNLGTGDWIWQDIRHISDDDFLERSRRAPVEPGDIILSREGTVGIAAIVTSDMEVCMGQRLVQLKLDTRRLMPEYLLAQLLYLLKPQRISHAMTGSTSKHINVKDLRELKVLCPPIQEQLDFENFCDSAKKLRSRICILGQKSDVLSRSIQMASFKS